MQLRVSALMRQRYELYSAERRKKWFQSASVSDSETSAMMLGPFSFVQQGDGKVLH